MKKTLLGLLILSSTALADPIVLPHPIVLPAKTYDKLWVKSVQITAPLPTLEAMANITLIPYVSATGEVAPSTMAVSLSIPNIFARIGGGDTKLADIMGKILEYVSKEAHDQGKIH